MGNLHFWRRWIFQFLALHNLCYTSKVLGDFVLKDVLHNMSIDKIATDSLCDFFSIYGGIRYVLFGNLYKLVSLFVNKVVN